VLQVQYADHLLGRLLDALRSKRVYDRAVIVVTADHGASFVTGQPRRPVARANVGVIAPVPFFVKLPGQRSGEVDDGAVRTIDVLPTIAAAVGVPVPWKADGMPADKRESDAGARIDVSHAGEPVLTAPLRSVLEQREARDRVEASLLPDGVYALGPRPDLIGRRIAGGSRELVVERRAPVLPSFVSGHADGVAPDGPIAVAVNGRVAATTRAYRDDGRTMYAALVPPSTLRDGRNTVTALEILGNGELREIR
jgi:hypothetical protein